MTNDLYFMAIIITVIVFVGLILSSKTKKKLRDKHSIISWYNHLIDQYISIYETLAEQFNEKIALAENYKDWDSAKRLNKLHDDTVRTSENIEKKLAILKINIADKNFHGVSIDDLYNDLKVVESYVAELANIATLIRSIHPVNRSNNFGYEYEKFTSNAEPKINKPWKSSRFFASCNSKDDLVKKYRELAKIYHPDNATTGNADSFKKLKGEYDEYLKIIQ